MHGDGECLERWRRRPRRALNTREIQYCQEETPDSERCSAHILRHTFALSFLPEDGNQFALQRILGHSTLKMTRRYVNLVLDDILEAHRIAGPVDRLGL